MEKIKPSLTSVVFVILTLSLFVACIKPQMQKTTETGVYHLVKKNETVQMIATAYDVPLPKLVRTNNITDINSVKEGSVIFIPSASSVKDVAADVKNKNTETNIKAKKNKSDNVEYITKDKGAKEVKVSTETPVAAQKKETIKTAKAPKTNSSKIVIIGEPAARTIQNKKTDDEKISTQSKTSVPKDEGTKKDTKEAKASAEISVAPQKKETMETTQYPETKPSKIAVRKESPRETDANKKSSDEKIAPQLKAVVPEKKMQAGKNKFIWPVKGEVTANFGIQPNKTFNNWIKIISNKDTKVTAAESGMVIFSSNLKNYGETIIIRHMDNYATVYTHLGKRYAKIDKNVKKGETIAALGEKDEKEKVYMNFEVRLQGKARNPLPFLP
jgi:murein DD-endopeptidase MepM/ murein hydrolase activator NlpD